MSKKYVYLFSEGNGSMRELLGGKGANLAEMTNLGMPVPQGFTVTTEACTQYYEDGRQINEEIQAEIYEYLAKLEEITGSLSRQNGTWQSEEETDKGPAEEVPQQEVQPQQPKEDVLPEEEVQ